MKCRHCHKELEENPLHLLIARLNPYRHKEDQLYACFDEYHHALGTTAQPDKGEEDTK
jgi:hypothetical protein